MMYCINDETRKIFENRRTTHFYRSHYSAYPSVTPHTRVAYNCDIITRPRVAFVHFFRRFFDLAFAFPSSRVASTFVSDVMVHQVRR